MLQAVRQATADTLIVADGFSCREQIAQGTGRRAVHVAHALRLAMNSRRLNNDALVEDGILPTRPDVVPARDAAAAALIVVGVRDSQTSVPSIGSEFWACID
jgi:hypothetical protein